MKQTQLLKLIVGTENKEQFYYFMGSIALPNLLFYIKKNHIIVEGFKKKESPIFISRIKTVNSKYVNLIFPMTSKRGLYSRLDFPEHFLKNPFPHDSRTKGKFLYLTYKKMKEIK